jgi:hypothetical protein
MKLSIETEWITYNKHGKPFVRRMLPTPSFIEPTHTEWRRKMMKQYFRFEAESGELLQVRIREGSWKNDTKEYAKVASQDEIDRSLNMVHQGLIEVPQTEAGRIIADAKGAAS